MKALRLRKASVIVGLALVPWCWVVANTAYMLAIRDGGSDQDGASTIALMAAHPGLTRMSLTAALIGGILIVPAVLGFFRLAGDRLAVVIGGGLMVAGYVCYAGVAATGLLQLAMAEHGGPVADFAAAIDASMADPWGMWTFLLFILGNLGGTTTLAIGLWRAHVTPTWVPIGLLCWPALHVFGLIAMPNEVPQVVGAVIQACAFVACARYVAAAEPASAVLQVSTSRPVPAQASSRPAPF
jgi:hypothetical protein